MLTFRCTGPGSEEDRGMNCGGDGSRFGLCLIIIRQLDGPRMGSTLGKIHDFVVY